jgi:NAD(P)H-flavin reductase
VVLLYGSRTPAELLYPKELERWRRTLQVDVTVDAADPGWEGKVGFVAKLVGSARFDPAVATAFICGPEIMMRTSAQALLGQGVAPERIYVSMERNMQCGVGLCGHCQLGPTLICRDGPVYRWDLLEPLLGVREL